MPNTEIPTNMINKGWLLQKKLKFAVQFFVTSQFSKGNSVNIQNFLELEMDIQ